MSLTPIAAFNDDHEHFGPSDAVYLNRQRKRVRDWYTKPDHVGRAMVRDIEANAQARNLEEWNR
jgi:23S rRNA maturation mini-RNase III